MHNSQLLDKYRLCLPLSKSVRARELVLDALPQNIVVTQIVEQFGVGVSDNLVVLLKVDSNHCSVLLSVF